jgi:hypothetical protein
MTVRWPTTSWERLSAGCTRTCSFLRVISIRDPCRSGWLAAEHSGRRPPAACSTG